ncbi:MAG: hypothetical protein WBP11_11935 [Dokdonella sp.]
MIFVETPIFTAELHKLMPDEAYAGFQQFLIAQPLAGDLIQGTGGLRKMRWAVADKGKSGGVRVIYYFVDEADQIRLLLIYRKGVQDDLTAGQKRQLRAIKERWK